MMAESQRPGKEPTTFLAHIVHGTARDQQLSSGEADRTDKGYLPAFVPEVVICRLV
jgi:hypothetical protein